jgi:small subunit ribosomal protein S20
MNDSVKKLRKLAVAGNKEEATKMLASAYKAIDKAAKRGVIKKNTAARKKSRISASIAKIK